MKNMFPTYYQYNQEDYKNIWDNGLFVVDANVLLNLYRYTEETQRELLQILTNLSDRLWIPHQVGLEYLSNRVSVILEQIEAFDQITRSLNSSSQAVVQDLSEKFKKFKKRHPSIELDSITKDITQYFEDLIKKTRDNKQNHPDLLQEDPILEKITALFDNKVGEPFTQEELEDLFSQGERRYEKQFPPGYKDLKSKKGLIKYYKDLIIKSEYGDLIVWKQIIKKASSDKVSIIFITDDVKEDWWNIIKGRTIGPRNELVNEFNYETNNQKFAMYSTQRFMEYASTFLESSINLQAIEEIETLSEANKTKDETSLDMIEWLHSYKTILENYKINNQLKPLEEKIPLKSVLNFFKSINSESTDLNIINQLHEALLINIGAKRTVSLSIIKTVVRDELQKMYNLSSQYPRFLEQITDSCIENLISNDRIDTELNDEGNIQYIVNPF